MITRSQMRRQLRAQGGIMNTAPRKKFGIGSYFQDFKDKVVDRTRKLIPNELANVAVKAAPFVAPFNPAIAGIMRGVGRLDQRGNLTDALKQGLLTTAAGAGARYLGGQRGMSDIMGGGLRGGLTNPLSAENVQKGRGLFQGGEKTNTPKDVLNKNIETKPTGIMKRATEATIDKIPLADKLPQIVKEKLLVGGITGGASALYSYFTGEFEPQQPGETMGEYLARRNTRVKQQMKGYMDSYYTPLRNPQYAAMSDEEKDNYIDGIVGQTSLQGTTDYQGEAKATGGRVGLMGGSMPMGEPRVNQGGITELDYRAKGGFVPVGIKEKADDVPAMLSKNEFVFTADAVRGAGNGSIENGAQKMYDTMKNLERRVT